MIVSTHRISLMPISLLVIAVLICSPFPTCAKKFYDGKRSQRQSDFKSSESFFRPSPPALDGPDAAHNSTAYQETLYNDASETTTFLSNAKASAGRLFIPTKRSSLINGINSAMDRLRYRNRYRNTATPRQKLRLTTQLSGGAESEDENKVSDQPQSKSAKAFLGSLRRRPRTLLPQITRANEATLQKVKQGFAALQETSTQVAPSVVTFLSVLWTSDNGVSFLSLYVLSLLGASCGFYLFLYFITVGYAIGITLPLIVALNIYKSHGDLSRQTLFHSYITVAWGVRILSFFLWREYFSWPALHQKVVELQLKMDIPFASRLLCWLVYSFFYVSMMASNWSRLQNNGKWGLLGYTGLLVQVGGLLLETIADMQKNGFKLQHRHSWCNVGVWKWSTHPNYLGEGLFWWGTYLAHGFDSPWHSLLATIGLAFVMTVLKGSTRSLSRKHIEKYSDQPGFYEFHRTHSIWGPKNWWWWLHGMEGLSSAQATVVSLPPDDNITRTATTPEDVAPPIQL